MKRISLHSIATLALLLCSTSAWCKAPFRVTTVTEKGFAPETAWYTLAIGSSGLLISDNADKEYIATKKNVSGLTDAELWCFSGDEKSGYTIYNKQAGTKKVLAALNSGVALDSIQSMYKDSVQVQKEQCDYSSRHCRALGRGKLRRLKMGLL